MFQSEEGFERTVRSVSKSPNSRSVPRYMTFSLHVLLSLIILRLTFFPAKEAAQGGKKSKVLILWLIARAWRGCNIVKVDQKLVSFICKNCVSLLFPCPKVRVLREQQEGQSVVASPNPRLVPKSMIFSLYA